MNSRHRKLVLVLLTLVGSTLIWAGCAGMAEPLPSLAVAPASLTVSAKVGSTSALPVTITNTGTTPLSVTQAVLSGTGFSMSGLAMPVTLPGGQSTSFTIKFAASQVGVTNGNVEFMTDSRHAPHTLPLHGTGSSQNPVVASIVVSPPVATPAPSAKVQFTAAIQGATTNDSVTWVASIGTISATGVFTAPSVSGIGTIVATSVADPTKSATATVAVADATPPLSRSGVAGVTVTPGTASSVTSGTLQFKASVAGKTSNTAVTWKASLGTITSAGSYTAPAKAGADTVTATSVADSAKSGSATVTVTAPASAPVVTSISVSPSTANLSTGGTKQFSASVQGTDTSVTWTAALGTINSSGLYTAPAKAGTDTVTATSSAQSNKSASATVTVTAPTPAPAPPPSNPSSNVTCSGSNCPSFPGAQGGGAGSVGGRGGVVIEVTNTNDSGTGSLRACVMASGPRTCVFRVAGLFPVTSGDLRFASPFLTVAGQTAPGEVILGGPNTGGALFGISTHDVILRYVTMSPDNYNQPSGPDAGTTSIWIVNCGNIRQSLPPAPPTTSGCYNIMVDHVTTRWSGNKSWITTSNYTPGSTTSGVGPNHSITTQWSLDYEPHEGHPVGFGTATDESCVSTVTQGACLSEYETDIDFHHNLLVNVDHRIPEIGNKSTRWVNNIVYNWGTYAMQELGAMTLDIINNKYIKGNLNANAQAHPTHWTSNGPEISGNPSGYMSGNIFGDAGDNTVNADQWGELAVTISGESAQSEDGGPVPSSWQRNSAMPASNNFPIVPDPATQLDSIMLPTIGNSQHLDCNGNWVSHRDAADQRIIAQYQTGGPGGYWPNGVTFTGIPTIPQPTANWQDSPVVNGTACVESMHDGIPDTWKQAKGLSLIDPNLYNTVAPNGYTWLENYLSGQ